MQSLTVVPCCEDGNGIPETNLVAFVGLKIRSPFS